MRTIEECSYKDTICKYHGIFPVSETGIREHHPFYSTGDAERGKINARKAIG